MSKKEKSIELLNKAVNDELLAVHQYMYFHFRCDDMGFDLVSNLFKRIAIQEMMHVEQLAERILFLKGEVEMKVAGEVRKLTEVKDMLEQAVKMDIALWHMPMWIWIHSLNKKYNRRLFRNEQI